MKVILSTSSPKKPDDDEARKSGGKTINSGADKDRITDTDKAIIDVKARKRKIKTYMEKLENQDKMALEKIKELMKNGQKPRALIYLKQKKFTEKEIEKVNGAMLMLE